MPSLTRAPGVLVLLILLTGLIPGSGVSAQGALLERAAAARGDGRYEEAARILVEGLPASGGVRAQVALAAAEAFLAASNYSRAADLALLAEESEATAADAYLLHGQALIGLGAFDDAETRIAWHLESDTPSGPGAFVGAELREARGNASGARGWYALALDLGLSPMWEIAAQRRIAESLTTEGAYSEAARWYGRAAAAASILEDRPPPTWFDVDLNRIAAETRTPDLLLRGAQAHLMADEIELAVADLVEIAAVYPTAREAVTAVSTLTELGRSSEVGPYSRGHAALQAGRAEEAAALFGQAVAMPPSIALEAAAAYYAALALRDRGDVPRAIEELQQMAQRYPESPLAPDALLQAARLTEAAFGGRTAIGVYVGVTDVFPRTGAATQALQRAASLALDLGDTGAARMAWRRMAEAGGTASARAEGAFWLGRSLLTSGDGEAAAILSRAVNEAPSSYFGLHAWDLREGGLTAEPLAGAGVQGPAASSGVGDADACAAWLASWADAGAGADLGEVDRLLRVGLNGPARGEALRIVMDAAAGDLDEIARGLAARRLYPESITAANRLALLSPAGTIEAAPACLRRLAYPLAYRELVDQEARAHGVDPFLLWALMRQESWFGPFARSGAPALGLTQVTPLTAGDIARGLGRSGFVVEDLYRPAESVAFGAWYLAQQQRLLDRRPFLALAAYNAGPGSALRWRGDNAAIPADDFFLAIDFAETRGYVQRIYEQYWVYRELWG